MLYKHNKNVVSFTVENKFFMFRRKVIKMQYEDYRLIRNAFNDCYNVFYAKWSQKSLQSDLADEDWVKIIDEGKKLALRYHDTICCDLVKNMIIELISVLEKCNK